MAISKFNAKKVPALALVLVAMIGAVAGVLAASVTISNTSTNGEHGGFHNNTGLWTVTDNGLSVVNGAASTNATTAFSLAGTSVLLSNALTAGHWMDTVTFVDSSPAAGTFTATLKFYQSNGTPQGTQLGSTVTSGTWTTTSSSTGTITFYVDLGASPITAPVTSYITVA